MAMSRRDEVDGCHRVVICLLSQFLAGVGVGIAMSEHGTKCALGVAVTLIGVYLFLWSLGLLTPKVSPKVSPDR